jgi:uncharacterized small protein (DUF1192 family)
MDIQQSVQSTSQRVTQSVNTSPTSEARRFIEAYTGVSLPQPQPTPSPPPTPPPQPTTAPTGVARPTQPVPAEYPEAVFRRAATTAPTTAPAAPAAPTPTPQPRISISVIVSPTSVKPGETVNIRGVVTRDGQRESLARVAVSADGYSSTVYTNTSGEYQAVFTIRQDERPRRVTVNVSSGGATATSSFEITAPSPLQTGAQQVQQAVTSATQRIQESVQSASIQVRPEIELRPVAERAFIDTGRSDVIRGFQAEMYYSTAQGRRVRKTDAELEVTISGPRSANIRVRSDGTPYDMRDYPPGNYTISARWPGGVSMFLVEPLPGLLSGPVPLNSAPATATINIALAGGQRTTTTTPTGVQSSQNLEQEARNRRSQQSSRFDDLYRRFQRANEIRGAFATVGTGPIYNVFFRPQNLTYPVGPEEWGNAALRERLLASGSLKVARVESSLLDQFDEARRNADRLINTVRTTLNTASNYINFGNYASAIQTLNENERYLNELEQAVSTMERIINTIISRGGSSLENVYTPPTQEQVQRPVTEGRVPTQSRTEQTYTTGQTTPGLEVATSSKEAIRNRLAALRAELNSIIGEIPVRENAMAALERERGSLMGEIQSLRGRVQELQSRLNNLGSYVSNEAALRNRIASLRSEVEGLRAQLANLQAIRNDLGI